MEKLYEIKTKVHDMKKLLNISTLETFALCPNLMKGCRRNHEGVIEENDFADVRSAEAAIFQPFGGRGGHV